MASVGTVLRLRRLATLALAAVLLMATMDAAEAAVRYCAARIEAVADDRSSQADARRQALEQWRAQARNYGEGFTRWELASNRSLVCTRSSEGFRCRAGAAPCSITQNPGRVPEALKPPPAVAPFPPPKRRLDI